MKHALGIVGLVFIVNVSVAAKDKDKAFYSYPLDDARVSAAITVGNASPGKMMGLSLKDSASGWGAALSSFDANSAAPSTGFSLDVYTPFAWIAQNASWKAKKYQVFSTEDIADEMNDTILRVYANPDVPRNISAEGMRGTSGVDHVIVRSTKKKKFTVLQPLYLDPDSEYAQNAFGAEVVFTSQIAAFDLDEVKKIAALDKKGEFFIVIIGTTGEEKKFKVKTKHFKRLP